MNIMEEDAMTIIKIKCPRCQLCKVVKFGTSQEGKQRYQCRNNRCGKNTFLLDYSYHAYSDEINMNAGMYELKDKGKKHKT